MAEFSRTWWGKKFISAIESFTDQGRLSRGRSYARGSKILDFALSKGEIVATVRGSVNPYFGVYKEPRYKTKVEIKAITKKDWTKIIQSMATNASFVSKLLLNEVPENIESSFREVNQNLLPTESDFQTSCSCPDYANPCKHIAGVCYRLASELDEDPFLIFELRGLSREQLHQELAKTPLGKALVAGLLAEELEPVPISAYYAKPEIKKTPAETSLKDFWQGKPLTPPTTDEQRETNISAILVKKAGDFPQFWNRDSSFIATMEELYQRVKTKNKDVL